MADARQWLRKMKLIVAKSDTDEGIELSEFHVTFNTTAMVNTTPATLDVKIYNLKASTVQQLQQLPTTPEVALSNTGGNSPSPAPSSGAGRVLLQAGYEGNFGTIFHGDLMQVRQMWGSATDKYVELFVADGDWGHVWGKINTTLAAGWTPNDVNEQTRKALTAYGLTVADLPDTIPQQAAPRGKVCFGRARDVQRDLGRNFYTDSYCRHGNIEWLPASAYKPGEHVKVNATTGMIAVPQQTDFGITVRMLLNPSVGPGTLLEINNRSIQQAQFTATAGETLVNKILASNLSIDINANHDGIYKVLGADHVGDTRGNDWYTIATCMAQTQRGPNFAVQPPGYYGYPTN